MIQNKLFVVPKPVLKPRIRLFCFPFAGGSVHTYMGWVDQFDDDIELVLVQPPGRGSRMLEKPHNKMESIVTELMLNAYFITQTPYAFFGHSLGSRVAYELCCRFQSKEMPLPQYFIASGSRAPHLKSNNKMISELSGPLFIQELKSLSGTPTEILNNLELMEILLPLLRADFKIAETYQAVKTVFPFIIRVLHGIDDIDITSIQLEKWKELSSVSCDIFLLSGNHFFINDYAQDVIKHVKQVIGSS